MTNSKTKVKSQILKALSHPEAEEGLYFRNFSLLHEEDERPPVVANEVEILDALKELLKEGRITMDESGKEVVFQLNGRQSSTL
jgi:hypothetical protein